ncbi:MAG: polyamine ABC transporter substrate-binding protein [Gammaproteobacteria bacterium]|nr:polyamine ABC transporter substrate-binding protein [Gammaproteobacteria bacterium]MBU2675751.1 polyamine ABC transporter substrate-binding protein [Gammaproteobacteria bacterium]NNC56367.1 polyamine ABC transporter substrate-binding protein [Woeseiaceae bacterium]NNL49489.1 polyamine ABC transporter substrate-binding protein [Woeseiaceae bacterium]
MTARKAFRTTSCFAFLLIGACSGDADNSSAGENIVNVYNWADYVAPDTLEKFEAEYGIKVNYDIYDSSEVVDVKLLAGNSGYDVVVHSNQFSSRLAPIGIFEKLDKSKLANLKNLDEEVVASINVYDRVTDYNIPYHWGTTGYAWNVEMVRKRLPDHPMDSGDILFDPDVVSKLADCGVSLLDGPTDLFPMVLAYLGLDPSAVDDESLAAAEAQLKLVRPYIRYFSNQKMISDLPNKEVCVAMSWSGDFAQASTRAEEAGIDIELRYTVPKEGSGLWVDGVYIPSDAPHKENAYKFLNFLLRADIAADIANTIYYANANGASWQFIKPEIVNNPSIFPDEETWQRLYPILSADPKRERPRTRAFARVKSGI